MSDRENGNKTEERRTTRRIDTEDVISVGSRISWGAVLAGASVALAVMVALGWLSTAIGLSVADSVRDRTLSWGAMICAIITVIASLFVGGFVVSRMTAGEDKTEALTYGVVLWGFLFAVGTALAATGTNVGLNALNAFATRSDTRAALPNLDNLGLSREQVREIRQQYNEPLPADTVKAAGWWAFAGIILSLAAAIGGAVVGAGPTLVLRQIRARRGLTAPARTQVQAQA